MTVDATQIDLLSLQRLVIAKNKAFTDALREKKPHHELVTLYNEVKEYYQLLHQLKANPV